MPNFRSLVFKSLSENSGMMKDFDMLTPQEVWQILMRRTNLIFISVLITLTFKIQWINKQKNIQSSQYTFDVHVLLLPWYGAKKPTCSGKLNYLTLTDPTKVWMPDTFFRNEKEAKKHEIIVPNVYVRIYPNGDILYSIRSLFFLQMGSAISADFT